tara:strand:- start:8806 stop:11301 length:2496 start_codon:yes stop_codon:yes gene_type:complete
MAKKSFVDIAIRAQTQEAQDAMSELGSSAQTAATDINGLTTSSAEAQGAVTSMATSHDTASKKVQKNSKKVAKELKKQRKEIRALRKDSANLDRLTGELSTAFALFSPEMAKAARTASSVAGGIEGIVRAMQVANPKLLALIAIVGMFSFTWELYTKSQKDAEKELENWNKKLNKMTEFVNKSKAKLRELAKEFDAINVAIADSKLEAQDITDANFLMHLRVQGFDEERIAQARVENERKQIERKVKAAMENRKAQEQAILDNVFQRGTILRTELVHLGMKLDRNGELSAQDKARVAELKSQLSNLREQRIASEKIIKEYEKGNKGAIYQFGFNLDAALSSQLRLAEELAKQQRDEAKRAERAARYKQAVAAANSLIGQQAKELDKVIGATDKLNKIESTNITNIQKNKAAELMAEAKLLELTAKRLEGEAKKNALSDAAKKKREAELILDKDQERVLKAKQAEQQKILSNAEATLKKSKETLATVKKRRGSKKALAEAQKKVKEAEEAFGEAQKTNSRIATQNEIILGNIQKKRQQEAKVREEEATQQRIKDLKLFKDNVELVSAEVQKMIDLFTEEAAKKLEERLEKIEEVADRIVETINALTDPEALTTLGLTAIGSIFGPVGGAIGEAIGGIVGAIAALGEKDPAEIEQEMMDFVAAFEKGLEVLPQILGKVVPKFAVAMAVAIIKAIPILIVEIFKMIGKLFTDLFDGLMNRLRDIFSISNVIDTIFANLPGFQSGGRFIPSARQGMRMTSGTGLALLHPNEYVVPQSGMAPQAVKRTMDQFSGGQSTNININSLVTERSAIDTLVRKIENRYQAFGSSKSTLFAS